MSLGPAAMGELTPQAALLGAVRGLVHAERLRCTTDAETDYLSLKNQYAMLRSVVLEAARAWSPPPRPAGLREAEWDLLRGAALAAAIEDAAREAIATAVAGDLPTREPRAVRLQQLAETVDALLSTLSNPPRSPLADTLAAALRADAADAPDRQTCALAPALDAVRALLRTEGLSALTADGDPARALETRLSTPDACAPALRDGARCQAVLLFDRFDAHLRAAETGS